VAELRVVAELDIVVPERRARMGTSNEGPAIMQIFSADNLQYTYSAEHKPIGSVQPGERFIVDTSDCFTGRYRNPADFNAESAAWVDANLNPVTGPISVEGAAPGGAVDIYIEDITVTTPGAVVISRCAALSPADWWHEEEYALSLPVTDGRIWIRDDWSVPVRPLIGCLATAPARETVLSRHEGDSYGGNMDCSAITAGATVTLPVEVAGGFLYFGDCKASMGAGEVTCSPECGTRIIAAATPVARPASMHAPRIRTGTHLTTIVSGISLADACRAAFRELKLWLEDEWHVKPDDAAIIMGMAADCGVCQVSNLLHTATCTIRRDLLPPGR
jgi:amidase